VGLENNIHKEEILQAQINDNTEMNDLINKNNLPEWFEYPNSFLKIVEQNLIDLSPWHILTGELLKSKVQGLKERYPKSSLIPFARRYDNDDVACWEKSDPTKVIIIHDFASEGWEKRQTYDDFWSWFRNAIEEMIEFD